MPEPSHLSHTLLPAAEGDSTAVGKPTSSTHHPMASQQSFNIEMEADDSALVAAPSIGLSHQPQHDRLRQTPVWGAAVNSIAFMCVPRSIPACFAATGWPLGIFSLLYSTAVTYDTGLLIGKVCAVLPAECSSFPGIAAEAGSAFSASQGHSGARQARWRRFAHGGVAVLQHTCYYLTGVSELIYFEQYLGQLFDTSSICQWQWLLLVGLISLPALQVGAAPCIRAATSPGMRACASRLRSGSASQWLATRLVLRPTSAQVPSFHATRFAALFLGVIPLVLNVAVFLYEILLVQPWCCEVIAKRWRADCPRWPSMASAH